MQVFQVEVSEKPAQHPGGVFCSRCGDAVDAGLLVKPQHPVIFVRLDVCRWWVLEVGERRDLPPPLLASVWGYGIPEDKSIWLCGSSRPEESRIGGWVVCGGAAIHRMMSRHHRRNAVKYSDVKAMEDGNKSPGRAI